MTFKNSFKLIVLSFVCLYCNKFQTYGQDVSATPQNLQDELENLRNELREVGRHVVELEKLRNELREVERHVVELEKLRNELREVGQHVVELEMNPFPAGFIYIQYHGTPEPIKLWPHSSWQEVTTNYAGLFFRAEGGAAAQFGVTQLDNSPRLTNVDRRLYDGAICRSEGHITLDVGSTSTSIVTGSGVPRCNNNFPLVDISFRTSSGEVRPRNQAIRMWQVTYHVYGK